MLKIHITRQTSNSLAFVSKQIFLEYLPYFWQSANCWKHEDEKDLISAFIFMFRREANDDISIQQTYIEQHYSEFSINVSDFN